MATSPVLAQAMAQITGAALGNPAGQTDSEKLMFTLDEVIDWEKGGRDGVARGIGQRAPKLFEGAENEQQGTRLMDLNDDLILKILSQMDVDDVRRHAFLCEIFIFKTRSVPCFAGC
jgi:hypothetical protein